MKRIDITGNKYGNLTVAEMLYSHKNKLTCCKCICDCGNVTTVYASNLKNGKSRSCGCIEKQSRYGRKHFIDITGAKFNLLTAINLTDLRAANGSAMWNCVCDCGNKVNASYSDLKRGRVRSCGCDKYSSMKVDVTNKKFGMLTVLKQANNKRNRTAWLCKCDCGTNKIVNTVDLTIGKARSCGCRHQSYYEVFIASLLKEMNIKFIPQYRFKKCKNKRTLPFDFFLPDYNTCIEYNGRQHYESVDFWGGKNAFLKRLKNDTIKTNFCNENNIALLSLPHFLTDDEIKEKIACILDPATTTAA